MIYVKDLLEDYREMQSTTLAKHIVFKGVGDKDVYNTTAPFLLNNTEVIAGRIESRDSELSHVRLFEKRTETEYDLLTEGIDLALQDPFYTIIDGSIILGGVEVCFEEDGSAKWRTILHKLEDEKTAIRFFDGPLGMKDLRLAQLPNKKILVLTRPQGEKGGRGKIGFTVIDQLSELTIDIINSAPLLTNQFCDEEWGGANEIHMIGEDICVLGHIANFDSQGDRHYYAMSFNIDLEQGCMINQKIIAERSNFLDGPSKRPDLYDVVFSGGILLQDDDATVYAGISDAGSQKLQIKNPFL